MATVHYTRAIYNISTGGTSLKPCASLKCFQRKLDIAGIATEMNLLLF